MPVTVSEHLHIEKDSFDKSGAFDAVLDVDSRLFIDPHLLRNTSAGELRRSHQRVRKHFSEILTLLTKSKKPGDIFWREAGKRLIFREISNVGIGYASRGTRGSGVGRGLRESILETAKEIVDAGIDDPEVFELIGLLQEGIGADRISDMVARIILPDLLEYSARIFLEVGVPSERLKSYQYGDTSYKLAQNPRSRGPIVLVPRDVLRDLPVAHGWEDIDVVIAANARLRRKVNQLIGEVWKKRSIAAIKRALRGLLLRNPDIFKDLIAAYKEKPYEPYDFEADPAGEIRWLYASRKFASSFPLQLAMSATPSADEVLSVVRRICSKFQDLVENNGLNTEFYTEGFTRPRRESTAQKLFYAVADAYCEANNLDLSRETNAGRGPVDFKVSHGYGARVLVELKLSTNTRLIHGFRRQLAQYQRAEKAEYAIFVVVLLNGSKAKLNELRELVRQAQAKGERVPEIMLIDGRRKPPASKF